MSDKQPTALFGNRETEAHQQQRFSTFASMHNTDHHDSNENNATRDASSSMPSFLQAAIDTAINGMTPEELLEAVDKHGQGEPCSKLATSIQISQEEKGNDDVSDVMLVIGVQGIKRLQLSSIEKLDQSSSSPRGHEQDGDCVRNKVDAPGQLQSHPPGDSSQTLLVSPEQSSVIMTSENSPDSSLIVSPHSGDLSLILDHTSGASSDDTTSSDDDSCDEDPLMIALGFPVVSQTPFSDQGASQETREEVVTTIASRDKGMEELDQEAIDRALAANLAIDNQNAKEGKKTLPEVDEAALIRRQSSRMSGAKSGEHSSGSKSGERAAIDGNPFRYSNSPPQPMASSPVFGTRPQGDLIMDECDEDNEELIAHPGLALLPGAYFMPGPSASGRQVSDMTDHSISDPDSFQDERLEPELPEREISNAGIDAELARTGASNSGVVVNGELVCDEDDMTEEERKAALIRWRRIQAAAAVGILSLAAIIAAVVVTSRINQAAESNVQPGDWKRLGSTIAGPPGDDNLYFGTAFSLSGSGLRFAAGLPGIDRNVTENDVGQVQIFDFADGEWVQTSMLEFDARSGKAGEALALSTDGSRVIVGSPFWSDEVGRVSVFEDIGDGVWQQVGTDIQGRKGEKDGRFGKAVTISQDGRIIAVGAPFAQSDASVVGVVRVYSDESSEWVQRGQDIVPRSNNTLFGSSIAMSADGNRIAIGAANSGVEVGHVDVFDFNDTHWTRSGKALMGVHEFESFGSSVALNANGSLLAVGAIGSSGAGGHFNSGKVQAFAVDADEWIQLGNTIVGDGSESLGASIDLSDDGILAVGCPTGGETGQVRVFYLDGTNDWTQVKSTIEGSTSGETFGFSVSISADGTKVGSGAPNSNFDGGRVKKVGAVGVYQNTNAE